MKPLSWQDGYKRLSGSFFSGLPHWLLALALIASVAGAAVGIVLAERLEGVMTMAVGQALKMETPSVTNLPSNRPIYVSVSDDGTQFFVGVEVKKGETFYIYLPMLNLSNALVFAELTLTSPLPPDPDPAKNITFSVTGQNKVKDVVQIAPLIWKFKVEVGASGGQNTSQVNDDDALKIEVKVGTKVAPGFYQFTGVIQQVAY